MKTNKQLLFRILFLFPLTIVLGSCEENNVDVELTGYWYIDKVVSTENDMPPLEEQNIIYLNLNSEKEEFTINLSVNSCSGKLEVGKNAFIHFFNSGCTEICCDTEWDMFVLSILNEVKRYKLNGTRLMLYVDDENYIESTKLLPE